MAHVHVNFLRADDLPTGQTVDETRKILWLGDDTAQVKCFDGVQIKAFNCDFSNAPVTVDSQETPNGYSDIIYRYHKTAELLSLWIACIVPDNTEIPKPDYQIFSPTAAATLWKAVGENDDVETALQSPPDWIPGALTTQQKKDRAITKIKAWREQKKAWLLESPEYADLVPEITKHLGYWLRSADYVLKLMYDMGVAGTLDWLIVEAIAKEATKGPRTLDPDGDGAYNVEFFQRLKVAAAGYPTGPTFGALWVRTWDLSDVSDVQRVADFTADVIQSHGQTTDRTYHSIPADYNSTAVYWSG